MTVREWREPLAWWQVPGELARLLRWLDDGPDGPMTRTSVIHLLEKPDAWADEYEEMVLESRLGHPPTEADLSPLLQASIALAKGARGR